jgi:transcriptional regulator with XRE-family HTH domain
MSSYRQSVIFLSSDWQGGGKLMAVMPVELFVRSAREAQGIQQGELAERIGVKPPNLNRFEKSNKPLPESKLIEAARILNLNYEYLVSGFGNPFRVSDPEKVIVMYFSETKGGEIDLALLSHMLKSINAATFVFLTPSIGNFPRTFAKMPFTFGERKVHCGLVVQDEDGNLFIFKGKKGAMFGGGKIVELIYSAVEGLNKYFEVYNQWANKAVQELLVKHEDINATYLRELVAESKIVDIRRMATNLIRTVWSHPALRHEKVVGNEYISELRLMGFDDLEKYVKTLMFGFSGFIKEHPPTSRS